MSKYDLRDVSRRLTESRDIEAVVFEFLGYLESLKPDWRATLAFYEVSLDSLTSLYKRDGDELVRREIQVPVEQLPTRMVRKFFHPSALSDNSNRRSLLASLFKSSPFYEPDPADAYVLRSVAPIERWESFICMPLTDQEDLLAILFLASAKRNSLGGRAANDLIPVKGMAALAIAQHLYRTAKPAQPPTAAGTPHPGPTPGAVEHEAEHDVSEAASRDTGAGAQFQEQVRRMDSHAAQTADHVQANDARLAALSQELQRADQSTSQYRQELERVKQHLQALEEQSSAANQLLSDAYSQLTETQDRSGELRRTVGFLQDVFQMMSQEHDAQEFAGTMVLWFSENFTVERCSLMVLDGDTMRIAAQRGIDPGIASKVRVRVGQGISGWVAHNRKPLFVRVRTDAREGLGPTGQDVYNSDSFITVPLVNGDRVVGVLNLSNKSGGLPFDQMDLDRAMIAGSLLAMTLGADEAAHRAQAWG